LLRLSICGETVPADVIALAGIAESICADSASTSRRAPGVRLQQLVFVAADNHVNLWHAARKLFIFAHRHMGDGDSAASQAAGSAGLSFG